MGQNRGKFNQLKSLLQSSERVQTSDEFLAVRTNKQVLFDPSTNKAHGLTGFNNSMNKRPNVTTGRLGVPGSEKFEIDSINMSMDRSKIFS